MTLITPEQSVQLIKNGHTPDDNHWPVLLLVARHEGDTLMQFMLTHVNPDYPDQAFGLIDFGHGRPRLSTVFMRQLETFDDRHEVKVEPDTDFVAQCPISVYAEAARQMNHITTSQPALQWAATHLELTKARTNFVTPTGPAFLPFPPSMN